MDLSQYINLPFTITDAAALIVIVIAITLAIKKGGLCEFLYLANLIITLTLAYKACLWISEQLLPIISWVWLTRSISFIIIFALLYTSASSTIQKLEKKLAKKRHRILWFNITDTLIASILGLIRAILIISAFYAIMLMTLYQNQPLPPMLLNGVSPPWIAKILAATTTISGQQNQLNSQIQKFNSTINNILHNNNNPNQQQHQQQFNHHNDGNDSENNSETYPQNNETNNETNSETNSENNTEPYPINPEFNPEQYNNTNQQLNNQNRA